MYITIINHPTGDQLPILLDHDGLPIPAPNEFVISRRALSSNTLIRNLRELSVLYMWLDKAGIILEDRINKSLRFNEAEIKGGLVEFLRKNIEKRRKVKNVVVTPTTFNQRLTTIRSFLAWYFDVAIGQLTRTSDQYEQMLENKVRLLMLLETSFINAPPSNRRQSKGLSDEQTSFLITVLSPGGMQSFNKNEAVQYRNYILVMIMLFYGLRPGELLSLKVEDVVIGAIPYIRIERRPSDQFDTRKPRPRIKRNGRILPIDDPAFAKRLDAYILHWRDKLEEASDVQSDYLILSDEGKPLSQPSLTQFFQLLRRKFPDELPNHLTAKCLRHRFSSEMERVLRNSGMQEENRKQALAYLRGDSSLASQNVYIAQEIEEQANVALTSYQNNIMKEKQL